MFRRSTSQRLSPRVFAVWGWKIRTSHLIEPPYSPWSYIVPFHSSIIRGIRVEYVPSSYLSAAFRLYCSHLALARFGHENRMTTQAAGRGLHKKNLLLLSFLTLSPPSTIYQTLLSSLDWTALSISWPNHPVKQGQDHRHLSINLHWLRLLFLLALPARPLPSLINIMEKVYLKRSNNGKKKMLTWEQDRGENWKKLETVETAPKPNENTRKRSKRKRKRWFLPITKPTPQRLWIWKLKLQAIIRLKSKSRLRQQRKLHLLLVIVTSRSRLIRISSLGILQMILPIQEIGQSVANGLWPWVSVSNR